MKNKNDIKILAIESSCDETAAAVISGCHPERSEGSHQKDSSSTTQNDNFCEPVILSNIVSSQADLHAKTGGVVPEVASRAHIEAIVPVISEALIEAQKKQDTRDNNQTNNNSTIQQFNNEYQKAIGLLSDIDYIAVTVGPGLIGSLLVGYNAAKTLAYANNLPIVPINHIEGHIYSAFSREISNSEFLPPRQAEGETGISNQIPNSKTQNNSTIQQFNNQLKFPILALTVSGGHTSLTLMKDHGEYETIGQTLDDAAGEAFDKVAKLLDLGYPGGPAVSKLAAQFRSASQKSKAMPAGRQVESRKPGALYNFKLDNLKTGVVFPRPILNDGTFNFSFSGLKTAVLQRVIDLRKIHGEKLSDDIKSEICAAFEDAVVDVLVTKSLRAIVKYKPKAFVLAGGVAANKFLRAEMKSKIENSGSGIDLLIPPISLCGDNAAMIGLAAYYHIIKNNVSAWDKITVDSNFEL